MACPYLEDDAYASSCVTKGNFHPTDEYLTNFCKNLNEFKKCATFREWTRLQYAPIMNKIFAFAIPILFYLNLLSLALIFEIIKINDSITILFGLITVVIGAIFSSIA